MKNFKGILFSTFIFIITCCIFFYTFFYKKDSISIKCNNVTINSLMISKSTNINELIKLFGKYRYVDGFYIFDEKGIVALCNNNYIQTIHISILKTNHEIMPLSRFNGKININDIGIDSNTDIKNVFDINDNYIYCNGNFFVKFIKRNNKISSIRITF